MMIDLRVSRKTASPQCCSLSCCGNHFGRVERSIYTRHSKMKKIRRYAKHVERQIVKRDIYVQLQEMD